VKRRVAATQRLGAEHPTTEKRDIPMFDILWGVAAFFVLLWLLTIAMHFSLRGFTPTLLVLSTLVLLFRAAVGHRFV